MIEQADGRTQHKNYFLVINHERVVNVRALRSRIENERKISAEFFAFDHRRVAFASDGESSGASNLRWLNSRWENRVKIRDVGQELNTSKTIVVLLTWFRTLWRSSQCQLRCVNFSSAFKLDNFEQNVATDSGYKSGFICQTSMLKRLNVERFNIKLKWAFVVVCENKVKRLTVQYFLEIFDHLLEKSPAKRSRIVSN